MNQLKQVLTPFQTRWNQLSTRQRRNLTITGVALILTFSIVIWLVTRPNYVTIMSGLDNTSLGQVQTQLATLKIPNQIQGSSILVPKTQADTARVQLSMAGLPKNGQIDYSSIPNSYATTQAQFNVQVLNVLQNSLQQTIDGMDGIVSSNVHIVMPPQNNIFVDQTGTTAKASVFVQAANGTSLSSAEVAGIQSLVAHSVPGLTTDNVTVVDQSGRTLSSGLGGTGVIAGSYNEISMRQQMETNLQQRLTQGLEQIAGYGNVVVTVHADVTFNQVKSNSHSLTPAKGLKTGLPTSKQTVSSNSKNSGGSAGGLVGQSSTNPGLPTYPGTSSSSGNGSAAQKEDTTNYDNNYTNTTTVGDPIQIGGYSVGVFVNQQAGKMTPQFQKEIKSFVQGAIGTQPGLKNSVSVSAVPFHTPNTGGLTAGSNRLPLYSALGAGAMLLLALGGGGFYVWRRRKAAKSEAEQLLQSMTNAPGPDSLLSGNGTETDQLQRRLEQLAAEHPAQFVGLLQNWLREN